MTGSEISRGFRLGKLVRDHVRKIRLRFRFENCFQIRFGKSALVPGSENGSRSVSTTQIQLQGPKLFRDKVVKSGSFSDLDPNQCRT